MGRLAVWFLIFVPFGALAQTGNVTPFVCPIVSVTTGGTAVKAIPGPVNGAVIANPSDATETLFVDQVMTATTTKSGSNYPLAAGQSWYVVPHSVGPAGSAPKGVSVNAATSAHSFFCIMW